MNTDTVTSVLAATCLLLSGAVSVDADEMKSASVTNDRKLAFFDTLTDVLPGHWEGDFADGSFENPTSEWRQTRVDYYLTAGGTAIVEDYLSRDQSIVGMTTVYHQDNNDIRATHYCGAKNHPRMISRMFNPESQTISFGFVDIANLKQPDDYHSREIELTIVDQDNIRLTFFGLEGGQQTSRVFRLSRMNNQD